MPVVRGCRFPYIETREHWECMHSEDPKYVIQGGGGIATGKSTSETKLPHLLIISTSGIYYRRCDGVFKNLEGEALHHVDCVESGDPKYIVQGTTGIMDSIYYKHCSGAYLNSVGGILST